MLRKRFPLITVLSVLLCISSVFSVEAASMWSQTYGGTASDYGFSVVETSDGGYAIAGYTTSYGAGSADVWLVKTDASGTAQWNQTYGGTSDDQGWSMVETGDGGYVVAGWTDSFGAGGRDVWLVKTDEYGVVPEFQFWIILPLLMLAPLFAIILKKKRFRHLLNL